jgi:hypothetical protein
MKYCLIIFIFALITTTWLTDPGGPPTTKPMIVTNMEEMTLGAQRKDAVYGNFTYVDSPGVRKFLTRVEDMYSCCRPDYPYAAATH